MLTNDVTLGELLELQRSIPRGGSSFYVDSSLLARMLAELVRIRTADHEPPADPTRCTEPGCGNMGTYVDGKCGYHTAVNRQTNLSANCVCGNPACGSPRPADVL